MALPKVLLVSAEFPPRGGGVGAYTRRLAEALLDLGTPVEVATSSSEGEDQEFSFPVWRKMADWSFASWGQLRWLLAETRPSILHIQYQAGAYRHHPAINLSPYWVRFSRSGMRVAVTFHDLRGPYLFPKAGPLRAWSLRLMARSADVAIVADRADQARLARWGVAAERIPIGSNIDPKPPQGYDRADWRSERGVKHGDVVLAYFGFLHESKGADVLVEALSQLVAKQHPVSLLMVGRMAGESNPTTIAYAAGVRERLARDGLDDRVHWTGYLVPAEVSGWLMAADLCVLPYADGASLRRGSLMAALAHGLPVVTTFPSGPVPELVDGVNAALVAPGDAAALAARIEALAASPGERERLGRGARKLSRTFSWDRVAAATMDQYRRLLGANAGAGSAAGRAT
ncbi:MAG: glycosyltransferase family 4 protein [Anaerolineae bacterium]